MDAPHTCLNFFTRGETIKHKIRWTYAKQYIRGQLSFTSEVLWPNMNVRFGPIRATPIIQKNSNNSNSSVGNFNLSFYTRQIVITDGCHKKRMAMLAYTPVEFNQIETLSKTFIVPSRQNSII